MQGAPAEVELRAAAARRWVPIIFAMIIVSFLGATTTVHLEMRRIDRATLEIVTTTAPSIERLADARAELRRLQTLLEEARDELDGKRTFAPTTAEIDQSRRALDRWIDAYLALPAHPDESGLSLRIERARAELRAALATFADAAEHHDAAAASRVLQSPTQRVIATLYEALTETIRANAAQTLDFAQQIRALRHRATILALVLAVVCVVIAVGGAVLIRRLNLAHLQLIERHRRLTEEKASELEGFADRVAHDILSPLNAIGFALDLAGTETEPGKRRFVLERGAGALRRITTLVSGLLDFARAGGRPAAGASADLASTIEEVVQTLEQTASRAGAALSAPTDAKHVLACNPGVLTSLLSNLTSNALKYIGDGPERMVKIRTRDRGHTVRVEVTDNGPGVPAAVADRVFEPYVRAAGTKQSGIGLWLATVKRLAEGHGGAVGLASVPGPGATFWCELPKASATS